MSESIEGETELLRKLGMIPRGLKESLALDKQVSAALKGAKTISLSDGVDFELGIHVRTGEAVEILGIKYVVEKPHWINRVVLGGKETSLNIGFMAETGLTVRDFTLKELMDSDLVEKVIA